MAYKRKGPSMFKRGKKGNWVPAGPYAKRRKAPQTRKKLVKLIKKVAIKTSEPKHVSFDHGKVELYHNSGSITGRTLPVPREPLVASCMPAVGTLDIQRVGDQIYSSGLALHFLFGQKQDRMNVTFRIVVLRVTPDEKPASLNDLIENTTGNILLDAVNTDRGKVVYQKFIKKNISPQLEAAGQQRELTFPHKVWIPYRRLIKFPGNAGTSFAGDKIYVYVFAYDAYGTLIEDNIAYYQMWSKFYYRDP